jgi:hypothetical protein
MKPLYKLLLVLLLSLTYVASFSQKTDAQKPKLFANYPETIDLSKNTLQNTFNATQGQDITVAFSDNFHFQGTVLSNEVKYANLQCVIIQSAAFGNSIFQLSKLTNDDNTITYTGRIINPDAFDGYQVKKDNNNNYTFQKFETKNILQDCSY